MRALLFGLSRLLRDSSSGSSLQSLRMTSSLCDAVRRLSSLEEVTPNVYRADHLTAGEPRGENAYGGLLFAQALLAAQRTVDNKFIPHALHSFFILNVAVGKPVHYRVQRVRDGRSFTTRFVQAEQNGQVVFTAQISFNIQEETSIEHQCKMPSVPPPEDLRTTQENAKHFVELEEKGELQLSSHVQKELRKRLTIDDDALFQFKPVTPKHYFAIEPFAPETISHWIKFKVNNIGEDRNLHRFLVAFITDATLVAVANRPHKSHGFVPSMLFSLDHSVHFHDDNFRADEWMLYENWSPIAKNGRAYSEGRLWSRDGRLILSATQESLCRTRAAKSQL